MKPILMDRSKLFKNNNQDKCEQKYDSIMYSDDHI